MTTLCIQLISVISALQLEPTTTPMTFTIVDSQNKPIEGAAIYPSVWSIPAGSYKNKREDILTNKDGVAVFNRPKRLRILRVWAYKEKSGYAQVIRGWETGEHNEGKEIPDTFTFTLYKTTSIGGRIVNDQGHAIAGARIEAECEFVDSVNDLGNKIRYSGTLGFGDSAATTDDKGYWHYHNVPNIPANYRLRVVHDDYISDENYGDMQLSQGVTAEQLRARKAIITMKTGGHLYGTVTDTQNKSIAQAVVVFHNDPYLTRGNWEVLTDEKGRYSLPTLPPGEHPITIVAQGQMPIKRIVTLKPSQQQEDFQLPPGKTLRIKTVDEEGQPVQTYFGIRKWKGGDSLYATIHPDVTPTNIPRMQTKADGLYEWKWAPDDAVQYSFSSKGYQQVEQTLTADGTTKTIVMKRVPLVSGTVTDAITGKPIETFEIIQVLEFSTPLVNRGQSDNNSITYPGPGQFTAPLQRTDTDYRLVVEAPGYRTAVSSPNLVANKVRNLNFKLEPAPMIQGRIVNEQGKSLQGVTIALGTTMQGVRYPDGFHNLERVTDDEGRFEFPPQTEPFVLFAHSPEGYIVKHYDRDDTVGDMQLSLGWVTIKGTLWQNGQSVANQTVLVYPVTIVDGGPGIEYNSLQVRTDSQGGFQFRLPVSDMIGVRAYLGPWEPSKLTSSEEVIIVPKSGGVYDIALGKNGASLSGTVVADGTLPKELGFQYSLAFLTKRTPTIPYPKEWSVAEYDLATNPQRVFDDDKRLTLHHRYFVKMAAEGTYHIDGVPPGDYWFSLAIYDPGPDLNCLVAPLGRIVVPVTVTQEQATAKADIILPKLEVEVSAALKLGEPLPNIKLKDANGKVIDRTAWHGQPVLLHAWASWCQYCPRDYAAIRELHAKYPQSKLAIVGLNLDSKPETAIQLSKKYEFTWPQATLGSDPDAKTTRQLHIGSIPQYFLLDAEGKLLYSGSDINAVRKLLRE